MLKRYTQPIVEPIVDYDHVQTAEQIGIGHILVLGANVANVSPLRYQFIHILDNVGRVCTNLNL